MESINILIDQFPQINKPTIKRKTIEIVTNTGELHEVLNFFRYPQVIITQIYFSEQYGNLTETIDHSILYLNKIEQVKKRFIKTIQYPLMLFIVFYMLLLAVSKTILPQFKEIYQSMNVEVSSSLNILIYIFSYLPTILMIILLILIFTILVIYSRYLSIDVSKKIYYFNKIPIIRKYVSIFRSYHLSRDFSFFIQNGIRLNKIIEIYISQTKDDVLKYIGIYIKRSMQEGTDLPNAIKALKCFEETLIEYIKHGENKSKLDSELYYFSVFMLDKLERNLLKHLRWVQPIIFAILSLLIISLYLIIILPMLNMVDSIK